MKFQSGILRDIIPVGVCQLKPTNLSLGLLWRLLETSGESHPLDFIQHRKREGWLTSVCFVSVPFRERENLTCVIHSNFLRSLLIEWMKKPLFHVWGNGVSDRQPQAAHMKWKNQGAAANTSDLIAYICLLNTQRKMMVRG